MKYHFKVHKEVNGFWAECLELKDYFTQGDTIEELNEQIPHWTKLLEFWAG